MLRMFRSHAAARLALGVALVIVWLYAGPAVRALADPPPSTPTAYDNGDGTTTLVEPDGTYYVFDADGVLRSMSNTDSSVYIQFNYDETGSSPVLTTAQDASGNTVQTYGYDSSGNLSSIQQGSTTYSISYSTLADGDTQVTTSVGSTVVGQGEILPEVDQQVTITEVGNVNNRLGDFIIGGMLIGGSIVAAPVVIGIGGIGAIIGGIILVGLVCVGGYLIWSSDIIQGAVGSILHRNYELTMDGGSRDPGM